MKRAIVPVLAGILLAAPVWAASMPSADSGGIDMTVVITDQNGRPAPDISAKDPVPPGQTDPDPYCVRCPRLTRGRVISEALLSLDRVHPESADKKWADAMLAMQLRDDRHAVLNADQVAEIKKKLADAGGIVIMQIFPVIDPNAKPPAVKP